MRNVARLPLIGSNWKGLALYAFVALVAGCAGTGNDPGSVTPCDSFGCLCLADSNCLGGRKCDVANKVCVNCLADGDCPNGTLCSPSHMCAMGCSVDHGCGDASVCEVDAGSCVECSADTDCRDPKRPRCDVGQHLCFPCLPSKDQCGVRTFCEAKGMSFLCAPGCKSDADCVVSGDGGVPDAGVQAALHCDKAAHQCVKCLADSDCALGKVCKGNACVDGCGPMHGCDGKLACCGQSCVDQTVDEANCGACGNACAGGWNCCNSGCSNPEADLKNCGGCGTTCAVANGTPKCAMRACAVAGCNMGFADCNGVYGDGCETEILANINNCGGCNRSCSIPHAASKCQMGGCAIDTCIQPYGDCNGLVADGCETSILTDANNCGACKMVCTLPNATPVCAQGVCRIGGCNAGWADCNNDPKDGCEVHIDADPNHCGSCAKVCSSANGTPTCAGGLCQVGCKPGFGDCDGDPNNGCETNLTNNVSACGACGNACNLAHATANCASSQCVIASCAPGFADCDAKAANGCETGTTTDVNNCGGCARVCSTKNGVPSCGNGTCAIACAMGFGNCNADVTDGCEATFASDANNCGSCGKVCSLAHATAACMGGGCVIATCDAGYADCNADPKDGCEVNVTGDINHCGGCLTVCSTVNGSPSCAMSACKISCTAGFGNCDGMVANGCETSTATDAKNCGACATACSANHIATPTCAGGSCNGACDNGYYDCNSNKQVDGCESFIATDPVNCGACGSQCSNNNIAAQSCAAGKCTGTCKSGFGDCNNNKLLDGCETTLNTSANCGACGNACGMGLACINGNCAAVCSVKVNEVQTGTTFSGTDEFVELYNPCNAAVNLSGWRLVYRSSSNNNNAGDTSLYNFTQTLPAGGYLLLVGANYVGAGAPDGFMTNGLAATGGAVGIKDAGQTLIDSVSYDTLTVANSFTEGTPAPNPPSTAPPGSSIGRLPNGQDTNNNLNDFKVSGSPTPGGANM